MTFDYDVIVVGARVAGAPTAMLLARQGHRVLMVDRTTMPSDTVSTHAILRTGTLQLTRWGLLDRVVEAGTPAVRDITLGFGSERINFEIKDEYGIHTFYAPRRYILDSILVDAAVEARVEFRGGTRLTDLIRDKDGAVNGVVLDSSSTVTARMVIGADGVRSRVGRIVGAETIRTHEPTNAVNYAYFSGVDADGFWFQFTPGINAGLIPTNDGQCLVFAGRPTGEFKAFREDPDGEFERLLAKAGTDLWETVAAGTRETKFHGTPGLPGFIKKTWGPGWALVGDAGYTKDAISAHGISDAFRDAELCATAVDSALITPSTAQTAMHRYEETRNRLSLRMFEESKALARYEWDADEASARMRTISDQVRRECDVLTSMPDRVLQPI